MIGAVSAADENIDDALEVSDEISVEEVTSSDIDVSDESGDVLKSSEWDVLGKPNVSIPEQEFKSLYGVGKNYTLQFYDGPDMDPVTNQSVTITIINLDTDDEIELSSITDENGNANFLIIDLPVGECMVTQFEIDGYTKTIKNGRAMIYVFDPDSKGHVSLSWTQHVYGREYQVIACNESIQYGVAAYDLFRDYVPDAFIEYSIGNITGNLTSGGKITLDSLPVGVYVLNVTCPELDVSTNTTLYVLEERIPTISAEDMTVVGGDDIQFKVKLNDRIGTPKSYYTVYLSEYALNNYGSYNYKKILSSGTTDEDGIVIFNFNLTSGIYTVGTQDNYETMELFLWNITVLNQSSIVESDTGDLNKVLLSFTDINGTVLADSEVKFLVGGETYNATTDENGVASFDYSFLPLGEYNITIVNPATGQKTVKAVSLTTDDTISALDNITYVKGEENKYLISVCDVYGAPLVNQNVRVYVDDNEYLLKTDENGIATLYLGYLYGGSHVISIENLVTGQKLNTTVNSILPNSTASASNVNTVYNGGKYIVFTLKNTKDVTLSGRDVSVNLNGKIISGKTDYNGQFKVSTDALAPKKYTATFTFLGDKDFNPTTATASVVVTKATPKMTAKAATLKVKTKTKKYTITLKDNKNKVMKKVKVTLKVKGKTYKATTNNAGKATFKITNLTKKGKFTANVKFAGNTNFKAVSKSVKLTVK